MRTAYLLPLALVAAVTSACSSVNMNVKENSPEFPSPLLIDGLISTDGLRDYDGNILDINFLGTGARRGELFSIEIWPYATVGVGLLGFRLQLLPLELGVGTILYEPSRETGGEDEPEPAPEPSAETGDGDGAEETDTE